MRPDHPRRLSVIIPVHNGMHFLERCLASLRRSDFVDYECIVVDDGSSDGSGELARRHGMQVLRLEKRGGPGRARNHGATLAGGEILAFFDADVCVHHDTLSRLVEHLDVNPAVQALIGSYDDTPSDAHFVSQYKNLFHHFVHQHSRIEASTFWAGCGAIRRRAFTEIGGFDESYGRPSIEDIELGARMHARGWRIDLNPAIQVTHLKHWTLYGLLRTDIRDRAIPWLLLMLRDRSMPADLNATLHHRVSVVLAGLLAIVGVAIVARPSVTLLAIAAVPVAALVVLNADLYRFFASKRGFWFSIGAMPLHWLYYLYCGLSVVAALMIHTWRQVFATPRVGAR